jgi:glycosyltransferase involved in cell wall biosynthesis
MIAPISVIILTVNEELNLPAALDSVKGWAEQVFVVDSFSADRTVEIAKSYGVNVTQHEFLYPAQQKNWAMENLPLRHDWLLLLDADERVSPLLRDEIIEVIKDDGRGYDGFWMRYRLFFYGRWIRHCGWYPTWILRLVRRSNARWEDRPVDEHIILDGKAGYLQNDLIHENLRDMEFWIAKHNRYSTQNAELYHDLIQKKRSDGLQRRLLGNQAERKRLIKERIWPYLPFRSILFFIYLYFIRLGFLDGKQGFIFCLMQGIFQEFVTVKLWELKKYKNHAPEGGISRRNFWPSS